MGVKLMGFSKLSTQCQKCKHKNDCDEKRMMACAVANCEPAIADVSINAKMNAIAPVIRKRDLRDVWIDKNTTITIDLEDIKEQRKRDFYKSIGLPGCHYGA